jgi:hypothetical protein
MHAYFHNSPKVRLNSVTLEPYQGMSVIKRTMLVIKHFQSGHRLHCPKAECVFFATNLITRPRYIYVLYIVPFYTNTEIVRLVAMEKKPILGNLYIRTRKKLQPSQEKIVPTDMVRFQDRIWLYIYNTLAKGNQMSSYNEDI